MGLTSLAERHLGFILEVQSGAGSDITVTDPAGTAAPLRGRVSDIGHVIDPETGQLASGRLPTVSIRISALTAAGFGLPEGISDSVSAPWLVSFDDVNGNNNTYKIEQSGPDRLAGLVTCLLGLYRNG